MRLVLYIAGKFAVIVIQLMHLKAELQNASIFTGNGSHFHVCLLLVRKITSRPAIAGNPSCSVCLNLGQNITAKSVHLTSIYPMALTSTNDHLSVLRHYVCT